MPQTLNTVGASSNMGYWHFDTACSAFSRWYLCKQHITG